MEFNPHLKLPFDEFFEKNKNLMHYIANRYEKRAKTLGIDYDDLISLASIGMINAYRKFDPTKFDKPMQFSTYAVPLMSGEILRFLRDRGYAIRFPRRVKEIAWKIQELELEGKEPEDLVVLLNDHLPQHKLTPSLIIDAFDFLYTSIAVSLNKKIGEDDEEVTLEHFYPSFDDISSLFVEDFISSLPENEGVVLSLRMKGLTQRQIGKAMGYSQVQVSRFLKRLPARFSKYKMEEELDMKYTSQDREEAIRLLKETKKTYAEISKTTGIPFSTVAKLGQEHRSEAIRKQNISVTASKRRGIPQAKRYDYDEAQVVALVEEGKLSYKEISRITGAPTGSITTIVRKSKLAEEEKMRVESSASQSSNVGIHRREGSQSYDIYGEDIPSSDLIKELEELLNSLKQRSEDKISFSLSIQTTVKDQEVS